MLFKNGDTLERTDTKIETFSRVVEVNEKGFTLRDDQGLPKTYFWKEAHLWKRKKVT